MSSLLLQFAFWISAITLVFTFGGYHALIALLARRRPISVKNPPGTLPGLSVVLVAHNEEKRIAARIQNLRECTYPAASAEIIVVSDGSTDGTCAEVERLHDARVRLIRLESRSGKATGLNAGIAAATGEVVVFADARQRFAPDALQELAVAVMAEGLGAVSGALYITDSAGGLGSGVDVYWRMERQLRAHEAAVDSCIGCTGAIYAIRRSLFTPLPADTILDDVVIPMQIALQGWRVGFSEAAKAFDPQTLAPALEKRRKERTLAGNFQMLFRYPAWLLPWKNRLWWQLLGHKYLRLAAPFLLTSLGLANVALWNVHWWYNAALLAQGVFYAIAALGFVHRARWCALPAAFVFLNVNVLRGFLRYLRRGTSGASGAW